MLIIERGIGEQVAIGGDVAIAVLKTRDGRLKIVFLAPDETRIMRGELLEPGDVGYDTVEALRAKLRKALSEAPPCVQERIDRRAPPRDGQRSA